MSNELDQCLEYLIYTGNNLVSGALKRCYDRTDSLLQEAKEHSQALEEALGLTRKGASSLQQKERNELLKLCEENAMLWDAIHKANAEYYAGRPAHLIHQDLKQLERDYAHKKG